MVLRWGHARPRLFRSIQGVLKSNLPHDLFYAVLKVAASSLRAQFDVETVFEHWNVREVCSGVPASTLIVVPAKSTDATCRRGPAA
jgi:hypothetical protein